MNEASLVAFGASFAEKGEAGIIRWVWQNTTSQNSKGISGIHTSDLLGVADA